MMQALQKKIEEEGEKEKELFEKFMCYCKNGEKELKASIDAAEGKTPQEATDIKEAQEKRKQLKGELTVAQDTRADDKKDVKVATKIRNDHHDEYVGEKRDYKAELIALDKAVAAIEKGMAGSFLQTGAAATLKNLVVNANLPSLEDNRDTLVAFLQGDSQYAPQSGQIVGILKQLRKELVKNLADATYIEEDEVEDFHDLEGAKTKEIRLLDGRIETRYSRIGEIAVNIAQMQDDLKDTEAALVADKAFLNHLGPVCERKAKEWEERQKMRSEELLAISDTIKVLNDDDALDLFKKTLPSTASSFMQVENTESLTRARALAALKEGRTAGAVHVDLVALALSGKKIGFEKVIGMIDGMVKTLEAEQQDDDNKKEYCNHQLDDAEDSRKNLEHTAADAETAINKAKDSIETLKEEMAALTEGIKALDESVSEATAQRKKEHEEFTSLMAQNNAAKELLNFAKNRLNKFYNPKLYKAPKSERLDEKEQIYQNMGGEAAPSPAPGGIAGTGITVLAEVHEHRAPGGGLPPPPDTFGAYTKKNEESGGIIQMIDLLIKDLDKEMTEAEVEEKEGQELYETMMSDSATKRAEDSKLLTEKEKASADTAADLEAHKDDKASADKELAATLKYLSSLHAECDWLLKYFDVRKSARASEIEALGKSKAVLSGADYALLQQGTTRRGSLRGA